jgi:hypothetical protein
MKKQQQKHASMVAYRRHKDKEEGSFGKHWGWMESEPYQIDHLEDGPVVPGLGLIRKRLQQRS